MVDACDQRGAALVVLDEMHLPKRLAFVEAFARKVGHHRLQLAFAACAGQSHTAQMGVHVEGVIVNPVRGETVVVHVLTEARIDQQSTFKQCLEA